MKLPLKLLTLMGLLMIIKGQVALQNLTKEELDSVIEKTPLLLICFHSGANIMLFFFIEPSLNSPKKHHRSRERASRPRF